MTLGNTIEEKWLEADRDLTSLFKWLTGYGLREIISEQWLQRGTKVEGL